MTSQKELLIGFAVLALILSSIVKYILGTISYWVMKIHDKFNYFFLHFCKNILKENSAMYYFGPIILWLSLVCLS